MNKALKTTAIVIGILIGVGVLGVGGYFLNGRFAKASDPSPHNVATAAITATSSKVTWTTDGDSQGVIEYGTSPAALTLFAPEAAASKDHGVDLTLLSPDTTYYFQIKIGDKTYSNSDAPWSFSTLPAEGAVVPTQEPTAAAPESSGTCTDTDCEAMKAKFGKGCTTQDYFKCVRKLTPTP